MADDLIRFLNGQPVEARTIGPISKSLRWSKRNPIAVSVVALLSLLLLTSGYFWNRSRVNAEIAGQRSATLEIQKREIKETAETLQQSNEAIQKELYGAEIRGIRDALQ